MFDGEEPVGLPAAGKGIGAGCYVDQLASKGRDLSVLIRGIIDLSEVCELSPLWQ